jgi:hypothetical protein
VDDDVVVVGTRVVLEDVEVDDVVVGICVVLLVGGAVVLVVGGHGSVVHGPLPPSGHVTPAPIDPIATRMCTVDRVRHWRSTFVAFTRRRYPEER